MDMGDEARGMLKMIHENHELDMTNKRQSASLIEQRNVIAAFDSTCKVCGNSVAAFDTWEHWKPHLDSDQTLEMDAETIYILDKIRSLEELEAVVKEQALIVEDTNNFIAAKKLDCFKCDNLISATDFSSHWEDHLVAEAAENAVDNLPVDNLPEYADNLLATPTSQEHHSLFGQIGLDQFADNLFDSLTAQEHLNSIAEHYDYHQSFFGDMFEDEDMPGPTAPNSVAQPFQPLGVDAQHLPAPPHGLIAAGAAAEGPQHVHLPELRVEAPRGVLGVAAEGPQHVHLPELGVEAPRGVLGVAAEGPQHVHLLELRVEAPRGVLAAGAAAEGPQHVHLPELGVEAPRGVLAAGAAAEGQPLLDPQLVNLPQQHQHVYPPANLPNPCLVCAFFGRIVSFPRKQELVHHKRDVHMNLAAGICAHCTRRGDYTALSNHLPEHYPPRPYPCPRPGCPLVYNNPRSLSAHLKRPH